MKKKQDCSENKYREPPHQGIATELTQAGGETSASLQPPARTANCSEPPRETNLQ
ncbi:hypothetical protein A2U01_0108217, partial [Trifolium medium]|nr:hypothetical protein [Trifolium medium]